MAQAGRSRLSGGERAVVVVSVVLVAVFAVLLAVRLTGSAAPGPSTAAGTGTASATRPTTSDATEEPTDSTRGEDLADVAWDFVSPSGNIACAVDDERALCGIATFEYADQIPAAVVEECDGKVGHFLQVTADGASFVCDSSGQDLTIEGAGTPALGYGQEERTDGFTCASEETGMTCRHEASGYSFSVRRSAYDLA
ncbi:DUF6636 domain-containing protein [Georgenia sp. SUBG003]|uniref:DUF6636 domain-containing protein n=1 Tax=Georgenia sp. SUBG003 TaxID=1497974 RepID=UPI0004D67A09|nr:hypothetical protein DA06_15430 [Georgenia sp. SUBG003]